MRDRSPEKEAYWRKVLHRQEESGQSVRRFCREEGISEASFYDAVGGKSRGEPPSLKNAFIWTASPVWVAQIAPLPTHSTSARVELNRMIQGATSQSDAGCDTCLDALSPIDCIPSYAAKRQRSVARGGNPW
ncbi:IS66 family insertion sequence element accessory protein TnpA [Kolteria novifilia]|uniref:IS66 family insertion sequence element accessory protein TnpA n=1 Tax=Kolteria novifilia TaxID=2527975 RepID=UPI003AF3856F